ncbi:hypothetical protein DASC09_044180 [Saccharomycopsis crataegensis]|uniref:Uncharacterized protein n=1 Tax=Saccharomycopsis crataegensis TaxID=43959 RepID=A0AAV5QSH4_9ASCO|nr:hypothetical protein DASC09_044180 [Saccharomycopsis crataegensis]
MFLPNLMPANSHHLWLDDDDKGSKYLRRRKILGNNGASGTRNQRQRQQQQSAMRSVGGPFDTGSARGAAFAPPLSSYSSACVGATISSLSSSDIFLNELDSRLVQLDRIKTYGFTYLKPLGIGKTMQTLIDEKNMELQENGNHEFTESMAGTAENLVGNTDNSNAANARVIFQDPSAMDDDEMRSRNYSTTQPQDEGTGFTTNNTTNGDHQPHSPYQQQQLPHLEVDLDANISNHDEESEEGDPNYLSGVYSVEDEDIGSNEDFAGDEGFMADEEYYEDQDEEEGQANQVNSYYDLDINSDLLQIRNTGTRNVSTSTRISSLNPELRGIPGIDTSVGNSSNNHVMADHSIYRSTSELARPYNSMSHNTTQYENSTRIEDSDMEME